LGSLRELNYEILKNLEPSVLTNLQENKFFDTFNSRGVEVFEGRHGIIELFKVLFRKAYKFLFLMLNKEEV